MRILKGFTKVNFCKLCAFKSRVSRNAFPDKFPVFCVNNLYSWNVCRSSGNSEDSSLYTRLHRRYSTLSVHDVIIKNEETICRYINNLMEDFRNNEDFRKRISSSFNSKHSREVSELLSLRSVVCESLNALEELNSGDSKDKELQLLAEEEKEDYKKQLSSLDYKLVLLLLPEEPHDNVNDLMIEIKHGVGGQEAMLFSKDLFEMYCRYITYKGWTYEIAELAASDIGGIRSSSILVYGKGAFKKFCYEGGVHRVQRVPSTEKGGRMHTSTVAVAILPQPSEVEVVINENDLKVETKRASGAGGQHVNKTDSAIRLTHLPTGTVVECQEDRSQLKNRKIAMQKLRAKLYETEFKAQLEKISRNRKLQFGTSGRSEKIRTYNFNQDRITDHRIGVTLHNMDSFFEGSDLFDKLLTSLQEESDLERLMDFISTFKVN